MRRGFVLALLALAGLVGSAGCNRIEGRSPSAGADGAEEQASATLRPGLPASARSVVLVTIDTLRADRVGVYGAEHAHTPNLDALAQHGTRFATAISAGPVTLPSHASILTGDYPPHHGVRHNAVYRLDESVTTLAERFQETGYATGAVVGSVVLSHRHGLGQGFDVYDENGTGAIASASGFIERPAEEVTDHALAWLDGVDGPFFLWVHYYDPHRDWHAPERYLEQVGGSAYDAEIAYVDDQLGRLLRRIDEGPGADRTLVVVTADHGESLGEHGERSHSLTLYDAVLAVPLVFRGPDVPAGRLVGGVVRTVDIAPTILELAGLLPLTDIDGSSLAGLWSEDATPADRVAYSETLATRIENGWAPLYAIRTNAYHYVRAPRPELYDLARDPQQLDDLLESGADEQAQREAQDLDAAVAKVLANEIGSERITAGAEMREKLAALGYVIPEEELPATGLDPKDGLAAVPLLWDALEAYDAADDPASLARVRSMLEQVVERLPTSSQAHGLIALIDLHLGQPAKGLPHIEAAIRINPLSAYYRAMLGEIRLGLGDVPGALEAYRQAIEVDPTDPWSQAGLVWEALEQHDLAAADEHTRQALAADPASGIVRIKLGSLWSRYGQSQQAATLFQDAVRVDPKLEIARVFFAIALARIGEVDDAVAALEQAGDLARDPNLASQFAIALARGGDPAGARARLEALVADHPGDPMLAQRMARLAEIESATTTR